MVAPSVLRERNRDALERASNAARALANEHPEVVEKTEILKNPRGRDYIHTESNRIVALADLLEQIQSLTVGEVEFKKEYVEDLHSLNSKQVEALKAKSISDIDTLRRVDDEDLLGIESIGQNTVTAIREEVGKEESEEG